MDKGNSAVTREEELQESESFMVGLKTGSKIATSQQRRRLAEQMIVAVGTTLLALILGLLLWYSQHDTTPRPPGPPSRLGLGFLLTLGNISKVHERFLQWFPLPLSLISLIVHGSLSPPFLPRNTEYGPFTAFKVLSLWIYVTSDISFVREIFSNSEVFQTRGVNGIRYFIPKSLLGLENCDQLWKQHRNIIIGAFTETYLKRYSVEILGVGKKLEENLSANGLVHNINETMADVAYEVCLSSPLLLSSEPLAGAQQHCDGQRLVRCFPICWNQN
jgi:hypothetical protein